MYKKKIIITGGAGFIGSHLTRRLIEGGAEVILLMKHSTDTWRIEELINKVKIVYFDDLIEYDLLNNLIDRVDCLIHLAFSGVQQNLNEIHSVFFQNIESTHALLKYSINKKIDKFLYTGSCFEYPDESMVDELMVPRAVNIYAAAKISCWYLAQSYYYMYGLNVIGLRPFTVYGPMESCYRLIPTIITSMILDKDIDLTEGFQIRDLVYVDDVVDAYLQTINSENISPGKVYNICTGKETDVRGIVNTISKLTGSRPNVNFGRIPYRPNEFMRLSGDSSALKKSINWEPKVNLSDGLQLTLDWFKSNLINYKKYYM